MDIQELILPGVVLGIILLMLVLGLFNRVIAKLGLRNFYRHKGHAIISIIGLLVGTSIICASMVVGDSIEYFIVEGTYNELELVDMVVTGSNGAAFDQSVYTILKNDQTLAGLTDGMAPLYVQSASVRNTGSRLFEPTVNVMGFDPASDSAFGEFIVSGDAGTGIAGNDLGANDSMINQALADSLGAVEGDTLFLSYNLGGGFGGYGEILSRTLMVRHVLADTGKTLFNPARGLSADTFNIFVNMDTAQDMWRQPGMYTHIKISNNGGVMDGAENSQAVLDVVKPLISNLDFHADAETVITHAYPNQTFAMLGHPNILPASTTLSLNGTVLPESAYNINEAAGTVMLFSPLQAGDTVTASYDYTYNMEVDSIKQDRLDTARDFNKIVSTFLTIFGSFAIIAGVILIINIFTMLAEERKSELGMARAVGMKRRHLMQSFLFEGLAYGGVASASGVAVGIAVGWVLIYLVNKFVNFLNIDIPFHFQNFSLLRAFSLGFIITFATILLTSWKISKLNIIRAIRNIEEPKRDRKGLLMPLLGSFLLAASAYMWFMHGDNHLVQLLGPSGMMTGAAMASWRWIGDRTAVTGASLGVFLWTFYAIRNYFGDVGTDEIDTLFILSGVIVVLSLVLQVMYNSRPVIRSITGSFGRVRKWRPTIMTAVSYPLTKKFRTGMSVGMFALVIYMVVMLSVFSSMFVVDLDEETMKQGGGYDIQADALNPVPDLNNVTYHDPVNNVTAQVTSGAMNNISRFCQLSRVYAIETNVTDSDGSAPGMFGFRIGFMTGSLVYGVDSNFYRDSHYEFSQMATGYDAASIWDAVSASGSDKIVVSSMGQMLLGVVPGNHVKFTTMQGNITQEYEVIGIMDQNMLTGVFMSKANVVADYGSVGHVNSVFLFQVKPGSDAGATARGLESDFSMLGMNTIVIREAARSTMETTNSLFVLFEIYLDMGLVVGVAGLGIITIRSVVERTPEIGILRSLGFKRSSVRNAFLIEILFIATLGVVIGVVTGVAVSHEIFNVIVSGYGQNIQFIVPWTKIAYVTAIAYIATVLCTIIPAMNASKIAPAEALRYVG